MLTDIRDMRYMNVQLVGSANWTHQEFDAWKVKVLERMDKISDEVDLSHQNNGKLGVIVHHNDLPDYDIMILKWRLRKTTEEAFEWVRSLDNWPTVSPAIVWKKEDSELPFMFFCTKNEWPTVSPVVYAEDPANVLDFKKWFSEDNL